MMMNRLFYLTVLAATLCACTITASDDVYTTPKPIITQPNSTVVVPAAIVINEKKDDATYVCTLKAFTSTYKSENESKGKAKLSVKKQCLNEFNEMFCQDKDIKCSEYK